MRRDWTPWDPQKVLKISMFLAIFTYFVALRRHRTHKKPSWTHLRAIWSYFGVILGSFWGHLGANFLDQSCGNDWSRNFGGIWEPFGSHLEPFWCHFGINRDAVERFSTHFHQSSMLISLNLNVFHDCEPHGKI